MIQPGRDANLPTSSGSASTSPLGMSLFALNGFTVTLGMVVIAIVLLFVWQFYFARKRRR